jgi:predicted esterase
MSRALLLLPLVAFAGCTSAPSSPSASPASAATPLSSESASSEVPVEGAWISDPVTRPLIVSALARQGFGEAVVDELLPPAVVDYPVFFELLVHDAAWEAYQDGGLTWSGTFARFGDGAIVAVDSFNPDCSVRFAPSASSPAAGDLLITVESSTCPGDLPALAMIFESSPFHRPDLAGLVTTEPGDPITPGASTSSQRLTLRPEGSDSGAPLPYAEYLPPDYGDGSCCPLLVFLHGGGEGSDGTDLSPMFRNAVPALIKADAWPDERSFVVLMPQHVGVADNPCLTTDEVEQFLGWALSRYQVDRTRVYLTGLSCGASAAWDYLGLHTNDVVTGAVLIAGNGFAALDRAGCELHSVAIWAIHGELDRNIDPMGSEYPIAALQRCPSSADARITIIPGGSHEVWDPTYDGSGGLDIYAWLLSHQRQGSGS